ncbi:MULTISPECIES: hypothetical protein [Moorena]|uniref:hypothetical protein n=1 Tax=Moorena TaxID=1155738 RepID=UPI0002F6CBBD|nr:MULTISPECIES: hypothetical protein [Moorena]NEP33073.1 hypothetical protein [Moorena sp. SIO3B2]NEP68259.1 hypothetical protein [Moorena sp. SIO3A5]NEQ08059.1 hypothetical protein [Moorena sp. SIO4E2]
MTVITFNLGLSATLREQLPNFQLFLQPANLQAANFQPANFQPANLQPFFQLANFQPSTC